MRAGIVASSVLAIGISTALPACETAPKASEQVLIAERCGSTLAWFKRQVPGLDEQVKRSAAYIVFPDVAQWGIIFGGGTWGRGGIFRPNGRHFGWTAINTGSIGLQAGVQGFRMLMLLEDEDVVREFMGGKWNGSASGVAVAAEHGTSGTTPFQDGVAIYQGANTGLMAGVNVGLNYIRYEPMGVGKPGTGPAR